MKNKGQRGNKKRHRRGRIGDITREIVISKAICRVHGPFMQTCPARGERFWPDRKEEHLAMCRPPGVHIQPSPEPLKQPPKPRKCGRRLPTLAPPNADPHGEAKLKLLALFQAKRKRVCIWR